MWALLDLPPKRVYGIRARCAHWYLHSRKLRKRSESTGIGGWQMLSWIHRGSTNVKQKIVRVRMVTNEDNNDSRLNQNSRGKSGLWSRAL